MHRNLPVVQQPRRKRRKDARADRTQMTRAAQARFQQPGFQVRRQPGLLTAADQHDCGQRQFWHRDVAQRHQTCGNAPFEPRALQKVVRRAQHIGAGFGDEPGPAVLRDERKAPDRTAAIEPPSANRTIGLAESFVNHDVIPFVGLVVRMRCDVR
ncbi:hypothetical protein [Pararhodobacter sp.]|uniref:hypothetical protein n=1 Tax=Pararhodobacter sp. TaxID=2127056 RepID=UPI002B003575|nr:hypothetical protein [Pararhodobacter sp.]